MKMIKNIALVSLLTLGLASCGSGSDQGELVTGKSGSKWFAERPHGMVLVPAGSFTMGKSDEDVIGSMNTPARTVTVKQYFMDETEVTNAEYRTLLLGLKILL